MKIFLTFILFILAGLSVDARTLDTIRVKPGDMDVKSLRKGNYNYILYYRKTKESPATTMILINMSVNEDNYHGRPAIVVKQRWERDTVVHTAYSVFSTKGFSSILHETWWKSLGYSMKFDFEAKKADYKNITLKNGIPDSVIWKGTEGFNQSFANYNLNWHDDLLIYTMLPYADNRTFIINYYDPGFDGAEEIIYTVTGSEILTDHAGIKIDCWVLNHSDRDDTGGYERFWISKKGREVLKEEDFGHARGFRFKVKLGI
jgi:hypothetical protein